MNLYRFITVLLLLTTFTACSKSSGLKETATETLDLQPWSDDPVYWSWNGEDPVLLLGGASSDSPFLTEHGKEDLGALKKTLGNYVEINLCTVCDSVTTPFAWQEALGTYQLTQYNEAYWGQLQEYLQTASRLGIAVKIKVWDWQGLGANYWSENPWITALLPVTDSLLSSDFLPGENPFFHTVPGALMYVPALDSLRQLQEGFVDQLLRTTQDLNNLIFDISVPGNTYIPWMAYWGSYLEDRAARYNRRVNLSVGIEPPQRMNIARFNQLVLSGAPAVAHPARPNGNGLNGLAQASIRGIRTVEQHLKFRNLRPAPEIFNGEEVIADAATDGQGNYLIYLPRAGSVEIYPEVEQHAAVNVTVVGYLGTQKSELLEPPYGESFRLFTEEKRGGWMILKGILSKECGKLSVLKP